MLFTTTGTTTLGREEPEVVRCDMLRGIIKLLLWITSAFFLLAAVLFFFLLSAGSTCTLEESDTQPFLCDYADSMWLMLGLSLLGLAILSIALFFVGAVEANGGSCDGVCNFALLERYPFPPSSHLPIFPSSPPLLPSLPPTYD